MAASTHTLVDGQKSEKPSASGFLDPRRDESDLEHGSTRAPSTAADADFYDKEHSVSDDDSRNKRPHNEAGLEQPDPNAVDAIEYPHGIKMVVIVIALMMAVFLISLDMVRIPFLGNQTVSSRS